MIAKNFKWSCLPFIIIVVAAIVVGIVMGGLNLGIDFTGGSLVTVEIGEEFDSETIRLAALEVDGINGDVSVVKAGENMTQAIVRVQGTGDEAATAELVQQMIGNIQKSYAGAELGGIDSVGGVASGDLIRSAFFSVLIAAALMLLYIWVRFDLYSGIGAVVALVHDVIIMTGIMCIFRVQIDSTFIAACLTIVGYSINDTVIVFDRIRENENVLGVKEYTRAQIADKSVRETIGRTINTSLTTLIMVACLYIMGVQSIKIFTLPLLVGVIAGTFSSMLIAPAVWALLCQKFGKKKRRKSVKAIR